MVGCSVRGEARSDGGGGVVEFPPLKREKLRGFNG